MEVGLEEGMYVVEGLEQEKRRREAVYIGLEPDGGAIR